MAAVAVLDFRDKWIWHVPPWWFPCLFVELCTKFGSIISYNRWEWPTFVTDVWLMTSGSVVSTRSCCIFVPSTEILAFYEICYGRRPPSWICCGDHGTTHEGALLRILMLSMLCGWEAFSLLTSAKKTVTQPWCCWHVEYSVRSEEVRLECCNDHQRRI